MKRWALALGTEVERARSLVSDPALLTDPARREQGRVLLEQLHQAAGQLTMFALSQRRVCQPRTVQQALEWLVDGEGCPGGPAARATLPLTLAGYPSTGLACAPETGLRSALSRAIALAELAQLANGP